MLPNAHQWGQAAAYCLSSAPSSPDSNFSSRIGNFADQMGGLVTGPPRIRRDQTVPQRLRLRQLADLILRSIAQRCVSKDGGTVRTRGHPSRRPRKSAVSSELVNLSRGFR
jgi:hypothetical protein